MSDLAFQEAINFLCRKFNVTAEYLIPKIQQYKLATTMYGAVVSAVFAVIILLIGVRTYKSQDWEDEKIAVFLTTVFILSIPVVIMLVNIYDYIGWQFAPEIKTIEWVTQLVKN